MVVKIRFGQGVRLGRKAGKNAHLASAAGGLMLMAGVSCLMFGLWRLTADVGWTGQFVIQEGLLSHWQVWLGLTIATGYLALRLIDYGRVEEHKAAEAHGEEAGTVEQVRG